MRVGNLSVTGEEAIESFIDIGGLKELDKYPTGTELKPYDNFGRLDYNYEYKGLILADTTGWVNSKLKVGNFFDVSDENVKKYLLNSNCQNKLEISKNFQFDDNFCEQFK
jgi:hypothetical protein